jgi:hypothetical protein
MVAYSIVPDARWTPYTRRIIGKRSKLPDALAADNQARSKMI